MIKYITYAEINSDEFRNVFNNFFYFLKNIGFSKKECVIELKKQIQYPYIYWKDKPLGGETILDVSSEYNAWPYFLKRHYPRTDVYVCNTCKATIDRYDNSFKKIVTDLSNIPVDDKKFDLIYCISTLEYINNWRKVLREFNRIIKDDGKLVMIIDGLVNKNTYFKEKDIVEMIEILKERFKIGKIDVSKSNAWLFSSEDGIIYSLVIILSPKKKI